MRESGDPDLTTALTASINIKFPLQTLCVSFA
jgi:hypothetical protein